MSRLVNTFVSTTIQTLNGAAFGAAAGASLHALAQKYMGRIISPFPDINTAAYTGVASFSGIQLTAKLFQTAFKNIPGIKTLYSKYLSEKNHIYVNYLLKGTIAGGFAAASVYTIPQLKDMRTPALASAFIAANVFTAIIGKGIRDLMKSNGKDESL